MADTNQNFQSQFFKITNRAKTNIFTVPAGQPITIIGGSLTILTDNSETIDMVVKINNEDYTLLSNYKINNDFPDSFIKSINRVVFEAGSILSIQAKNSFGVSTLPDIHGFISFIKQPKLS